MNFFSDNPDLGFLFDTADLDDVIAGYEDDFSQHTRWPEAPRDAADARDSYRRILEVTGDIAARIIAPRCRAIDETPHRLENGRVTYSPPLAECVRALQQADLMGCMVSRRYGGLNLPNFLFTMLVEIISQAEAGLQNVFGLQGIAGIIEAFADEPLKERFLPCFTEQGMTGAMALTEDEAGSDLQNVKLKAVAQPDGSWRLSGVKRFITNGDADVLLVLARSEPGTTDGLGLSLFVCQGDDSVQIRRLEDKLGIHGSPTCEMTFTDTPAWLVGERQRGLVTYVLALLNGARLATAAQANGITQAALAEARAYAHTRRQYGRRIEQLAPVADMLMKIQVELEGARALTYETARLMDVSVGINRRMAAGGVEPAARKQLRKDAKKYERLVNLLTSCAKYYSSEMSVRACYDAMQVMGGSGYMRDYLVEKYYRDARITTIYEGTSQLQILSAVRGILGGGMERYCAELDRAVSGRSQRALARRLATARGQLDRAVAALNNRRSATDTDLYSRDVVDMAVSIVIGYLLLAQSTDNRRKLIVARQFLDRALPTVKMLSGRVCRGGAIGMQHYEMIVGPPPQA